MTRLRTKGYLVDDKYVSPDFAGFDQEFRQWWVSNNISGDIDHFERLMYQTARERAFVLESDRLTTDEKWFLKMDKHFRDRVKEKQEYLVIRATFGDPQQVSHHLRPSCQAQSQDA